MTGTSTVSVDGTSKHPQKITYTDSLDPRKNVFSLDFASRDSDIEPQDVVLINRATSDSNNDLIFRGIVMAIKPVLTEKGHAFRVSGMNYLGKVKQRFAKKELISDTEVSSVIKIMNQPNRKIDNNYWAATASGSDSEHIAPHGIDRDENHYWECDVQQTTDEYFEVDMGSSTQVCRIRIEHELDCHPKDFIIKLDGVTRYTKTLNACRHIDVVVTPQAAQVVRIQLTGSVARDWKISEMYVYSNVWPNTYYRSDKMFPMAGDVYEWNAESGELEFVEHRAEIYQNWDVREPERLTSELRGRYHKDKNDVVVPDFELDALVEVDETNKRLNLRCDGVDHTDDGTDMSAYGAAYEIASEPLPPYGSFYMKAKMGQPSFGTHLSDKTKIGITNYNWFDRHVAKAREYEYPDDPYSDTQFLRFHYSNQGGSYYLQFIMWDGSDLESDNIHIGSELITDYQEVAVSWKASKVAVQYNDVNKATYSSHIPNHSGFAAITDSFLNRLSQVGFLKYKQYLYIKEMCFSSTRTVQIRGLPAGTQVVFVNTDDVSRGGPATVATGEDHVEVEMLDDYTFPMHGSFVITGLLETKTETPILTLGTITDQDTAVSVETTSDNDRLQVMADVSKIVGIDLWVNTTGELQFTSKGSDKSAYVEFNDTHTLKSLKPDQAIEQQINDVLVVATSPEKDRVFRAWSRDSTSIANYGRIQKKFPIENVSSQASALDLANTLRDSLKDLLRTYTGTMIDIYNPNEYLSGDEVQIKDSKMGEDGAMYVMSITRVYTGGENTILKLASKKTFFRPEFRFRI